MWLGMNTQHEKLKDIRVRQAIQHAVDVDFDPGGRLRGHHRARLWLRLPGADRQALDRPRSTTTRPSRRRCSRRPASTGLELELRTLNTQDRLLTAQIIQANLQAVGIKTTILPMDSGPFWDMGVESKGETWKELQLWLMRFGSGLDPFEPMQWFVKEQIGIWNWERWSDEEFEQLWTQGLAEKDPAKREPDLSAHAGDHGRYGRLRVHQSRARGVRAQGVDPALPCSPTAR